MAKKNATAPAVEPTVEPNPWEELIPYVLPKERANSKGSLAVGVNGRTYLIKAGERVMLPRPVYDIVTQSEIDDSRVDSYIADVQSNSRFAQ